MPALDNRKILLVITGGIAAYKSLDLIRRLQDQGADVTCILTEGGAQFVTPLSVAALSGKPVYQNMFSPEGPINHIQLSRQADLILIAPASADMMAKMAHGIADTFASTVLLAAPDRPVLLAPAMNTRMWQHPATQKNVKTLLERGAMLVGPANGSLACGETADGRLSEVEDIVLAVQASFAKKGPLAGKKALVTSGPTHEAIDPVRFIGNRSSGKQGHAIAAALVAQGADVTLVSGPTAQPIPRLLKYVPVTSAQEMLDASLSGNFDIAVCAAAVADWRPAEASDQKIKKDGSGQPPTFTLTENPDILATLSQETPNRPKLVIGFAAETGDHARLAEEKFKRKGCDWLLANDVSQGKVFGSDETEIIFFQKDAQGSIQSEPWSIRSKVDVAEKLVAAIADYFKNQN